MLLRFRNSNSSHFEIWRTYSILVSIYSPEVNPYEFQNNNASFSHKQYEKIAENQFRVTNMEDGVNAFLPCKYAVDTYKDELLISRYLYSMSGQLRENENGYSITRYVRYNDPIRFAETSEISYFESVFADL
jgi:hypothetical protein